MPVKLHNLILTLLFLSAACSSSKKDSGHYTIGSSIGKSTADSLKSRVRAISNDLFEPYQYLGGDSILIHYRLLRPQSSKKMARYPLVLVLHGSGAVGTDNIAQLGVLPKIWALPDIREHYPAYILVPQFPQRSSNYTPDPEKKVLVSKPAPCLSTVLQLVDSLKKALPVDETRIYVTGFSMGASSTINSLGLRPDLFAAAVPVSGIPDFNHLNELSKIPIWILHGNADHENPFGSDSLFNRQMQQIHSRHLRFWEIDGLEHDIYPGLYDSEILPQWLFAHRRSL